MNERQPSFKEPGAVTALRPAGCAVAGAGRPGGLNWGAPSSVSSSVSSYPRSRSHDSAKSGIFAGNVLMDCP